MKIDLDWIQEELDAGREVELECVDRIGFLKDIDISEANEEILDQGALIVDYIDHNGDIVLVGEIDGIYLNVIVSEEFKYFRIKRLAPTFDDLIDVAVRAYKNRLLDIFLMNDEVITVFNYDATGTKEGINRADTSKYYQFIDFINSLYTETFVIESQSDLSIIKLNDKKTKVKLTNGEIANEEFWDNIKDMKGRVQFLILKGATVTQKRG